jgi:hypothetical protein
MGTSGTAGLHRANLYTKKSKEIKTAGRHSGRISKQKNMMREISAGVAQRFPAPALTPARIQHNFCRQQANAG